MIFLYLIEVLVTCLVLVFVITQIFYPMWTGTPYFPSFIGRYKKMDKKFSNLSTKKIEHELSELYRNELNKIDKGDDQ